MLPVSRRAVVGGLAATPFVARAAGNPLAVIEAASGGRLGVAALNTGTGRRIAYRDDERFPMCSTFKLLLAGFTLARVDQGAERLDRVMTIDHAALPSYSPVTSQASALSVGELCRAAVSLSDNGATNLLLTACGGPAALTGFARKIGDPATRSDRDEPATSASTPSDPRDTTTPAAMLATVRALTLGTVMQPTARAFDQADDRGDDRAELSSRRSPG